MVSLLLPLSFFVAVALLWLLIYQLPSRVRGSGRRAALVVAAVLLTFWLAGSFAFVAVMLLVGPHSGIWPEGYAPYVLAAAVLFVIGLPVMAALTVLRRFRSGGPPGPSGEGAHPGPGAGHKPD